MNAVLAAANEVGDSMAHGSWRFCVIGGLAVQKWSEPRTAQDTAILLLTGWGNELPCVRTILDRFESRISDGEKFAQSRRVLLIKAPNGVTADIAPGALTFEVGLIEQSIPVAFSPLCVLPCCTAEDLFIMKAFAGRTKNRLDIERLVVRIRGLDKKYICRQLRELAEVSDDPAHVNRAIELPNG